MDRIKWIDLSAEVFVCCGPVCLVDKAYFPRKATSRQWETVPLCCSSFLPVPQRESFLALIFPQPDSIHSGTIPRSCSPSPALGTTKIPMWAVLLTPQICMQVASFHCHAPLHAVLLYLPWMKDWGSPHNLSAMAPELSPQHRAFNLGLWGTSCVAQPWAGSWMPWDRELSCTAGPGIPCSHWVWCLEEAFALLLRHIRFAVSQIPTCTVREQYSPCRYICGSQGGGPTGGVGAGHKLWRAWDGSLCSSWTLSLHCLQTVKLKRHVHLKLLSVSVVSFLNHLEKNPC